MLTTRMSPKISVKPLATTKNSAASVRPLRVTTAKVVISEVTDALASALGDGAVTTAPERLDAYTADTYWPALAAAAAGTPIARPEVVVRPRSEEAVAAAVAVAHEHRT